jgi:hypothetical protein
MTGSWEGGYRVLPEPLVVIDGDAIAEFRPPAPMPGGPLAHVAQGSLHQALVQWPGGFAVTAVLLAGLADVRSRRVAAFALAWLALGPVWALIARWGGDVDAIGPLQAVLVRLPGTSLLGNGNRLVVVPIVAAAVIAGPLIARFGPKAAVAIGLGALGAGVLETPPLSLPAVDHRPPTELLAAIDGPVVTFPSGDPPIWNPGAWPKEGLWLARHHRRPVAYDYGRGGAPADAAVLVWLSEAGGVAVGRRAAETMQPTESTWFEVHGRGFRSVLVLRHHLEGDAWNRVREALVEACGEPVLENADGAVWRVPSR